MKPGELAIALMGLRCAASSVSCSPLSRKRPTSEEMAMESTEITLTMPSLDQARAVMRALELYSRIGIGQFDEIETMVRFGRLVPGPLGFKGSDLEVCDAVGASMRHAKSAMGYGGSGWSITSDEVPLEARRAWEAYKVLAAVLGEGPGRDGLTVRCTDDVPPTAHAEKFPPSR